MRTWECDVYHYSWMFPFGELIENSQQIDARKKIAPTVRKIGAYFQAFGSQFWLVANDTCREIQYSDAET